MHAGRVLLGSNPSGPPAYCYKHFKETISVWHFPYLNSPKTFWVLARYLARVEKGKFTNTLTTTLRLYHAGNPYWKGRISTVDLLVLTSSNQLLIILKKCLYFIQNNLSQYKEVNCTYSSPLENIPCINVNMSWSQMVGTGRSTVLSLLPSVRLPWFEW